MEDLCICPSCRLEYNNTYKLPLILPCGHSYCRDCITHQLQNNQILCPEDKRTLTIRSIEALPSNLALISLITANHNQSNSCPDHKKPVEYVCVEDQIKICADCALFGRHRSHEIKQLTDVLNEITVRAECMLDMLQIIEQSQTTVMDEGIKQRLDSVYTNYCHKREELDYKLTQGFNQIRQAINDAEQEARRELQRNFNYIEGIIVNVRDMPKLIDSQTTAWKASAKEKLDKVSASMDSSNYIAFQVLDSSTAELFKMGEKLIIDLEELKDLNVEELENLVEILDISFKQDPLPELYQVQAIQKLKQNSTVIVPDLEESPTGPTPRLSNTNLLFNENIFQSAFDIVKNHSGEIADFSTAGCVGEMAAYIAPYLVNNPTLKTLKLNRCQITDSAAVEIFHALEENTVLQSLHLSDNSIGLEALDDMLDMLNINTTLRDIYIQDNPLLTEEYIKRFQQLSNRFRVIHMQSLTYLSDAPALTSSI